MVELEETQAEMVIKLRENSQLLDRLAEVEPYVE